MNSNHTVYQRPGAFVVVDFEATCCNQGTVPDLEREIIEFGAVQVDGTTLDVTSEFQAFVRPVQHPDLTPFCMELTGITQDEVTTADPFAEVVDAFAAWLSGDGNLFCSWGAFDRKQLRGECMGHGVQYPFDDKHLNLKSAYARHLAGGRRLGMEQALRKLGWTIEGTHHRALDDARNIARLLPSILGAMPSR